VVSFFFFFCSLFFFVLAVFMVCFAGFRMSGFVRGRIPKPFLAMIPAFGAALCILANPGSSLALACVGVASVFCYFVSHFLIDGMIPSLLKNGMFGKDLSKTSDAKVPEALGIVPGLVTVKRKNCNTCEKCFVNTALFCR
jgi:hypothetical protein